MRLRQEDQRALAAIRDALGSSLDIHEVFRLATPLLLKSVPADYAALGITRPGATNEFEWIVADMPTPFFAAYPEMMRHDFVLRSVLKAPNAVLRDVEMVPRRELEANMMYARARDLGMPLEQVAAVMLHVDDSWQSGISLYRSERRPFSRREQAMLQEITPALASAVRNCHLFAETARRGWFFEGLLAREGLFAVVLEASGRELARTEATTLLLEKWFAPTEPKIGRLPAALVEGVLRAGPDAGDRTLPECIVRRGDEADLIVRPYSVTEAERTYCIVRLQEVPHAPVVPRGWRQKLTRAEADVATYVLRGWDNRLIAQELRCSELTIKKHLTRTFDKLGVSRRAELIAQARREPT